MNFLELEKFLDKTDRIHELLPKNEKTFMDIEGFPHYENICSNILQFYLNPNEEHRLNDVMLKSLLYTLNNKLKMNEKRIQVTDTEKNLNETEGFNCISEEYEKEYFCDLCFKKITQEEFEIYDHMCEECYIYAAHDGEIDDM